jgi:hypothetical protein
MVMGHNIRGARYILTGDSIEDLEKGLAEMKRQIAAGITFSVCYGGDKSEFEKECDNDDCNDCEYDIIDSYGNYDSEYECEEDDDWKVCTEEDCDDCSLMDEDEEEEEEEETEIKEEVDKNEVAAAIAKGIVAAIKDFFRM